MTVVPMLAPMIIPTVCSRRMMPALTKPTHMTVVVAEEWISAVTSAPNSTPLNTLLVSFSKMLSSRPLETFSKPCVMVDIPNRNTAMAPIMVITSVIFTPDPPVVIKPGKVFLVCEPNFQHITVYSKFSFS